MTAASPHGERRSLMAAAAVAVSLAILTSWPLAAQLTTHLPDSGPGDQLGDPALVSWQIAWEGHAIRTDPIGLFDANIYHPLEDTLAFLDPIHGFAPVAVIGSGAQAALIRYNLLFLFASVLTFMGSYLLARELGLGQLASLLAGAAFAYAPWRLDQLGHLLVISSGGIPLALFMLLRGYRRMRVPWIMGGWLTATWQLSIGYTLGLQFAYLLAVLGAIAVARWLWLRRPPIPSPVIRATVAGVALFVGWGAVQAVPAMQVAKTYPEAVRSEQEVEFYSPPVDAFGAASERNLVWGDRTAATRATLPYQVEQTLFPGLTILLLALLGIGYSRGQRALRLGLVVGTVLSGYLAMGFRAPGGHFVYKTLFDLAPGWRAIRTPGRLMTTATLFLCLIAAFGLQQIYDSAQARLRNTRIPRVASAIIVALIALVVIEGSGPTRLVEVPKVPLAQARAEGPIAHLPMDELSDRLYMYWSTEGFPQIVNGVVAFVPEYQRIATGMVNAFPDEASVDFLRSLGIRSVVVHLDRLADPNGWEAAASTRAAPLGLTPERVGTDLVYSLEPAT